MHVLLCEGVVPDVVVATLRLLSISGLLQSFRRFGFTFPPSFDVPFHLKL